MRVQFAALHQSAIGPELPSLAPGRLGSYLGGTCQTPQRCHVFLWFAVDRRSPAVQHDLDSTTRFWMVLNVKRPQSLMI